MQVRLEQCTFDSNTVGMPTLLADNRRTQTTLALFYSDVEIEVCVFDYGDTDYSDDFPCQNTTITKGIDTISTPFPSANDAMFKTFQEVCMVTPLHNQPVFLDGGMLVFRAVSIVVEVLCRPVHAPFSFSRQILVP